MKLNTSFASRPCGALVSGTALLALLVVLHGAGCSDASVDRCDGFVCPSGTVCTPEANGCVLPEQISSCAGVADEGECRYPNVPEGSCYEGICLPLGCGNGELADGEVCDDGNTNNGDGCSADCSSQEICGNGIIDFLTEGCDDGNTIDGDGCQANCVSSTCGDGIVDSEFNEACDEGESNSDAVDAQCRTNCQLQRCGDGVLDSSELCDDGNIISTDGCSFDCQSDEVCGNGYLDSAAGELCDDGNNVDGDGCQGNCIVPSCGDGIVDAQFNEICDCGNDPFNLPVGCVTVNADMPDASCRSNCQEARCGDGIEDPNVGIGELCDDGNVLPGDGCSGSCQTEVCGNGILDVVQQGGGFAPAEECDDGENGLSQDGCAVGCRAELPRWTSPPMPTTPSLEGHAMVYDIRRGRTVAFGGNGELDRGNELWEWEGAHWTRRFSANPLVAPSERFGQAMVYADAWGHVILFGGDVGGGEADDTWTWDGKDWTLRTTDTSPPARARHAMAYDSARDRVVLFGGQGYNNMNGGGPFGDTWEWDGATWTDVTPPNASDSPLARAGHAMSYDPVRGRVVLFGDEDTLNDTWEWDGVAWTQFHPEISPPAQEYNVLAYDTVNRSVVMLGNGVTWKWDGSNWASGEPLASGMYGRAIVYDVARQCLVHHHRGQTWEFHGTAWVEVTPEGDDPEDPDYENAAPSARRKSAMAYDASRATIVLFGGVDTTTLGDTWEWNGSTWAQLTPPISPSARSGHFMYYDPVSERVVLSGGSTGSEERWSWDGSGWTRLAGNAGTASGPASGPYGIKDFKVTYDAVRRRFVLFGSHYPTPFGQPSSMGQTWESDGTTWMQIDTPQSPLRRRDHAMVYDEKRQRVILYGGQHCESGACTTLGDAWEWDGSTWLEIQFQDAVPQARAMHAMTYDRVRQRLVVFGGWDEIARENLGDTWNFQYAVEYDETCVYGVDGDNDGLIGCADPDCWGYCKPQCPPNSTPDWPNDCDASAPQCGDGMCNTFLESSRLCPADCGAPTPVCGDFLCDSGEDIGSCPGDCTP